MTTVAAGATGSFTFTTPGTVTFTLDPSERASMTVTRSSAVLSQRIVSHDETAGPFLTGDVLSITAMRTAIDYTINDFNVITAARSLDNTDDTKTRKVTTTLNVTVPTGLVSNFGTLLQVPTGVTASIVSGGGALLNGATTTVTRAGPQVIAVVADQAIADAYFVTGT